MNNSHLDDDSIARLAEGRPADRSHVMHAAECVSCRARVSAVARLTEDFEIRREIEMLEEPGARSRSRARGPRLLFIGGLAAAAAAVVLLTPVLSERSSETHRESSITSASSPQILSPKGVASDDLLRWSAVPQADLYRIRIWNEQGDVVWSGETKATSLRIPDVLEPGIAYFWEITARTGWDRWVSSEFVEFRLDKKQSR